jgi:hypothetical protein
MSIDLQSKAAARRFELLDIRAPPETLGKIILMEKSLEDNKA